MKILHINTFPYGGAFTGTYRLHQALLKNGIESTVLVREVPKRKLNTVFVINQKPKKVDLLNKILFKFGRPNINKLKKLQLLKGRKGNYEIITMPFSDYDITKTKEYKDCDLIHLHWIGDFLNYKSFFKRCSKPIVFTIRDLHPIQGIFHYENDKIENAKNFEDLEKEMLDYKSKYINECKNRITIVGISKWITEKSKLSNIHSNFNHKTIHNCIDATQYLIYNKNTLRQEFNIKSDAIVLSFVSDGPNNKRKGADILIQAIKKIVSPEKITVLSAGSGVPPVFPFNIIHRHFGALSQRELNKLYSVSDAFIFPTKEEALGNVMLEAMSCGTPVIGTPVGGLLDVIKPGINGIFSKDTSSEALAEAIESFIQIKDTFDAIEIRQYVIDNFSEEKIANEYIELYKNILSL